MSEDTDRKIHDIRVAFKELSPEDQRAALPGILEEHAYYSGLGGLSFPNYAATWRWLNAYNEGKKHLEESRKTSDSASR